MKCDVYKLAAYMTEEHQEEITPKHIAGARRAIGSRLSADGFGKTQMEAVYKFHQYNMDDDF